MEVWVGPIQYSIRIFARGSEIGHRENLEKNVTLILGVCAELVRNTDNA